MSIKTEVLPTDIYRPAVNAVVITSVTTKIIGIDDYVLMLLLIFQLALAS